MNTESDLTNALQRALTIDDDHLRRLRERLTADAEAEHVLDVAYRIVDSPVGSLLLAATDTGLVRVAYASEDHDRVLEDLVEPRSALASCVTLLASTPPPASSTSTSPGVARASDCPSTGACRPGSARPCSDTSATSRTGAPPATRRSQSSRVVPRLPAPSGPRAPPTPSRSWCPATASCGRTAAWAGISAGSTRRRRCSSSRPRGEDRAAGR